MRIYFLIILLFSFIFQSTFSYSYTKVTDLPGVRDTKSLNAQNCHQQYIHILGLDHGKEWKSRKVYKVLSDYEKYQFDVNCRINYLFKPLNYKWKTEDKINYFKIAKVIGILVEQDIWPYSKAEDVIYNIAEKIDPKINKEPKLYNVFDEEVINSKCSKISNDNEWIKCYYNEFNNLSIFKNSNLSNKFLIAELSVYLLLKANEINHEYLSQKYSKENKDINVLQAIEISAENNQNNQVNIEDEFYKIKQINIVHKEGISKRYDPVWGWQEILSKCAHTPSKYLVYLDHFKKEEFYPQSYKSSKYASNEICGDFLNSKENYKNFKNKSCNYLEETQEISKTVYLHTNNVLAWVSKDYSEKMNCAAQADPEPNTSSKNTNKYQNKKNNQDFFTFLVTAAIVYYLGKEILDFSGNHNNSGSSSNNISSSSVGTASSSSSFLPNLFKSAPANSVAHKTWFKVGALGLQ